MKNVKDLDLSNNSANMVAAIWMARLGLRLGRVGNLASVDNQVAIQNKEVAFDILEYIAEHPEIGEVARPVTSPIHDDFARLITGHANRSEALLDALRSLWLGDANDAQAKFAAAGITLTEEQLRRVTSS